MSDRQRRIAANGATMLAVLIVGLWTYGFSLRLPLFLDDMVHFRWLEWHNLPRIWSTSRLLGYYRPLPFTLWKVLRTLAGRYDPPTLHALNLGLHLLNASLVLALVAGQRQEGGRALGTAAALLFLLFPFSYQAVPWVGSLTHPLVTALILGSLVLYLLGRGKACAIASLALALLAPFAHETGVLIAPLLLLLLLTADEPSPWRQALRQTLPYWACTALGAGAWLAVPKSLGQHQPLNLLARWQNTVYYAQGLAYPAAPLAHHLRQAMHSPDGLLPTALVVLPAIAAWSLLLLGAGRGKLVALALGWFAVASTPAWVMLSFEYTVDGPRLLYVASVGAALFWALPVDLAWSGRRLQALGRGLATLAVLTVAASSYGFIRSRLPLYEQMRLAVGQLVAARPPAASDSVLCVNYPSWFAPAGNTFAVGHEGVTLVPGYSSVADLLWLHTGEKRLVNSVVFLDLLPRDRWRYLYACIGTWVTADSIQPELRQARRVIVTTYRGENVAVHDAGGLEAVNQPPAATYQAGFAGQVGLLSATGERQGQALRLVLRWQSWQKLEQETTVFVHLYDGAGRLVAQADGYPLMGTCRPISWQPGDLWRDVRRLDLPAGLAPGRYTLKVGLYPVAGGPRLVATDPAGQRVPDDAVPLTTLELP